MSEIVNNQFSCGACGKRYTWKPELAGKKAKCKCGKTIIVGESCEQPPPEPDDLYDFVDPDQPITPRPYTPPAPVAAASTVQSISYRSAPTATAAAKDRFSFDRMTHPPRDLYIPAALLIAGVLGILAWAMSLGAGPVLVAIVSVVAGIATLIKTAIIIGLAFLVAPRLGISFGDLRTAILKFAAIIIFTDAVGLWYDEIIEMVGGAGPGRTGRTVNWLEVLLTAALISGMCFYLFDMDGEETAMFAIPLAIVSNIIGFVLSLILGAILVSLFAAPAAPAPAVPAAAPGGAAAAPGPTLLATDRDREIERMIQSGFGLKDAVDWNQLNHRKTEPELVQQFLRAGAKKVYLESGLPPKRMVVRLPDDVESRNACMSVCNAYRRQHAMSSNPPIDQGQRFLELELKGLPGK